ncbi:hypothetical protein F4825DRAFT_429324 [Nemania diffusa]|nr:hypothetical protein F4825DRAFT_429324 [Nemania diffusa]
MPLRRMDHQSAQRISKARGPNDGFSRRASMTAQNESEREDEGQQQGSSGNQNEEQKGDDKGTSRDDRDSKAV